MKQININGKAYPCKFSMAAIKGIAAHLGLEFADMADSKKFGVENVAAIAYFGIKQGLKLEEKDDDITIIYIEDVIEVHESLQVMKAYMESVTGPVDPNAVSSEK